MAIAVREGGTEPGLSAVWRLLYFPLKRADSGRCPDKPKTRTNNEHGFAAMDGDDHRCFAGLL
jgi:hypothetical protein